MPRARRIDADEQETATVLIASDGPDASNPTDASEQWEEFERFRDDGEGSTAGMFVWVYRIPTDIVGNPISSVESELLFTAPIDVYTLPQIYERVKKEYMPRGIGRALIRIQVRREKVRGVLWQKMMPIAKGLKDDEPAPETVRGNSGESDAMRAIGQMVAQQTALIGRLMEQQSQRAAQPAPDPFAGAQQIVAMVTGLAGVLAKPAAPAAAGGLGNIAEIREVIKLAKDLGGGNFGGSDDGDGSDDNSVRGILAAVAPFAPVLKSLIDRAPPAAQPAPPRRLPAPAQLQPARPMPGAPAAPAAQPTEGDAMLLELKKHLGEICSLIEADPANADANGIALLILDAIPEKFDDKFYEVVADENYMLKLGAVEPRVKQHAEFFGKLRERILQEFADDTPENPAS